MSTSATVQEATPQWQTFLDPVADVAAWLQMDASAAAAKQAPLTLVTDMACQWVQRFLQRPVAPTEFFRRFDAWDAGDTIMLPFAPVLSVQSVVEWWGVSGPHTLVEQTPESQGASDCYQVEPQTGRITRTFMGLVPRPFFPGSRNIEVTWTAGFDPVPADIRVAALETAAWVWRNTQEAPRWFAAQTMEYEPAAASGGLWPGVPNRIVAWLEPYRQFTVV